MLNGGESVTQQSKIRNYLRSLEELRNLLSLAEFHVRFLPVGALPDEPSLTLHLAVRDRRPHALNFRAEQLLDRALDVDLGRPGRDLEHQRPIALTNHGRLLGDQRASDYVG